MHPATRRCAEKVIPVDEHRPEEKTVHPDDGQYPLSDDEPWETASGTFAELHGTPHEQGLTQGQIAAANIAANVQITRQVAAPHRLFGHHRPLHTGGRYPHGQSLQAPARGR
jgi:hypothetical protein